VTRRLPPLAANLLLGAASAALFGAALEGGARLLEAPRPRVAEYLWDWQARWKGEFYTVSSDASGWPPDEQFNADGLRDRAHPGAALPGTWRIAFLGDSVTLGDQLLPAHAYPALLEALLDEAGRRVETFNVALWGWSTRQQRIAYREILPRYRPDQVVLAVCLNDVAELQNNLARPPAWLAWLHQHSALVRRAVGAEQREIARVEELFQEAEPGKLREAWRRFFQELTDLAREVRADGRRFDVVVFPFRFQVARGAPPPRAQRRIAAFCAEAGLACLDLLPALAELGPRAFLDYDHLSPAGAARAAQALLASGIVPEGPRAPDVLARAGFRLDQAGRALRDRDSEVRAAAAWALTRTPSAATVPALVAALEDPSPAVRAEAADALGSAGAAAAAARPSLFDLTTDASEPVRWSAARALSRIGVASPEWTERLAGVLRSDDPYVRGFGAWTLGEIGPAASDAVPELVEALARDEAYGRGGAAAALARMGPYAAPAVPVLTRALGHAEARVRWNAARALGHVGPQAAPAVDALTALLRDRDGMVRRHAARALGRIGPAARGAAPALKRASRDRDRAVRREASRALRAIMLR
jgi:HEAT repeat protein/lysophospholipase L1-like esterase